MTLLRPFALALCALLLSLGQPPIGKAFGQGADCDGLRLSLDPAKYDLSCGSDSLALSEGAGQLQSIDATAKDSAHFLYIVDVIASPNSVFVNSESLESQIGKIFNLNISHWKAGRAIEGLSKTGEFTTEIKNIKSDCVAFRALASRRAPGWRRLVAGIACSRQGIEPLYSALEEIDFPG